MTNAKQLTAKTKIEQCSILKTLDCTCNPDNTLWDGLDKI